VVTIQTSHPRSVGQGVSVVVEREVEAVEDEGLVSPHGYRAGDTIVESVAFVITVDEDGKAEIDDDVWKAFQRNNQHESFGFTEVGGPVITGKAGAYFGENPDPEEKEREQQERIQRQAEIAQESQLHRQQRQQEQQRQQGAPLSTSRTADDGDLDDDDDDDNLDAKTNDELKQMLSERGLPTSGTKAELVDRLSADQ
jgi:hypothetical protein